MQSSSFAGALFVSKSSSAGAVYVNLGFVPDLVIVVLKVFQTNPDIYIWLNKASFPLWSSDHTTAGNDGYLLITGSTGVITQATSASVGIFAYAGGDNVTTAETDNTDGKHVTRAGAAITTVPAVTGPGIKVTALTQTASDYNAVLAFRADK